MATARFLPARPPRSSGLLFEGYAIAARKHVQEAILTNVHDGRDELLFGENRRLVSKISTDHGRTWGDTRPVLEASGGSIETGRDNVHLSLLQLKSGALGMMYGGPYSRPGRDGTLLYRYSTNGGASWSAAIVIDPVFSLCRTAAVRVLSSGRIVAPAFQWFSPSAGGDSESESNSINISWVFYSDDEGRTWKRSLSELFVSVDQGRLGNYSFEEPSLVELKDGRLLMFGRTELGRFYESFSRDHGISWSPPQPTELAASYAPPMLVRIPATGHLLLVWNQASVEEIEAGLSRHRLSTSISEDEGSTWGHFRNLESMDDRVHIPPPAATPPRVYRGSPYHQPVDRRRYPHAPGCLRICYPTVVFDEQEVAIAYDYGYGVGELANAHATKLKIVSVNWLYGG